MLEKILEVHENEAKYWSQVEVQRVLEPQKSIVAGLQLRIRKFIT
jgi:hypothetical protein